MPSSHFSQPRRFAFCARGIGAAAPAALSLICSVEALGQTRGEAGAQRPAVTPAGDQNVSTFVGVITGDDVYVRSGAGESYYPFYKLRRGDLLKVTEEKFGFLRVSTVGPAFRDAFGYVKDAKGDQGRLRMAADGKSAVALGRVDILAPNLDTNSRPTDSWKSLVRLEADQAVRVLAASDDGQGMLYKVALPAGASGWISSQFIARAGAEDAELFQQMLDGKIAAKPENDPNAKAESKPGANAAKAAPAASGSAVAQNADHNPPLNPAGAARLGASGSTSRQPEQVPGPERVDSGQLNPLGDGGPANPTSAEATSLAAGTVAGDGAAAASQPDKPREPTFEDLEKALELVRKQPAETAEIMPLRDLYAALAERHPSDQRIQRYTGARIRQLEVWREAQKKKEELLDAQERLKATSDEAEAVRAALERSREYVAVGRVGASTIYDGTSLPKLFRLQDPATGRTIAYLKPDGDYALANRIDIIVGIVGDKVYDESLRLNIITPRRIDALSPDKNAKSVAGASEQEDK